MRSRVSFGPTRVCHAFNTVYAVSQKEKDVLRVHGGCVMPQIGASGTSAKDLRV